MGEIKKLGFGMMRLPQLSGEATDIDFEQVSWMVDRFLEAGFTYFDTSWAYHNTASETAVGKCLVSRHPRESSGTSPFPTTTPPTCWIRSSLSTRRSRPCRSP